MERTSTSSIAIAIGPAAAIAAAGLLANVRDDIGTTNVALVVGGIVVLAAIAGRAAGVVTAIVAAVAYNFFNTEPYRSLQVADHRDVITIVLLVVIGIVVSEVASRRRRVGRTNQRRRVAEHIVERAVAQLAAGAGPDEMWTVVHDGLVRILRIADCRFEPAPMSTMVPQIGRDGELPLTSFRIDDDGTALPPGGAAVAVNLRGDVLGQVVLVPDGDGGSSRDERRIAIALVDLFALATASTQPNSMGATWQTS